MDGKGKLDAFQDFLAANKGKIVSAARSNTTKNAAGQVVVPPKDIWYNDNVWDRAFKEMTTDK